MAIEPVNERPLFPSLIQAASPGTSVWAVSLVRQLTTVFMQYGFKLNHTLLDEDLAANGGTIPEIDEEQTWTATQTWVPVQVFQAAPTATGHPLRFDELAANGGTIPETDRVNAFVAGQTQGGEDLLDEGTSGVVIQHAFTSSGSVVAATAAIPYDDTIPQITEGTQAFFINFTPKRADSRIRIEATLQLRSASQFGVHIVALFRAGVSDALGVAVTHADSGDTSSAGPGISSTHVVADMASPGTSSQTFSTRFGDLPGGPTLRMNANELGTRVFGGASASTMEVMEYMP